MGALTWMTHAWWHGRRPSCGRDRRCRCGAVAITPAAGFVTPAASILIGMIVAVACYSVVLLRDKSKSTTHSTSGPCTASAARSAHCTGLFATTAINAAGANGAFYGNPKQVLIQLAAVGAVWLYSAVATFAILKLVTLFTALRVTEKEEAMGLDLSQHSEIAYTM